MKKLIILLIAVMYMGAATGATVHIHYCMDKLVSWGLIKNKDGKCSKCGMKETKNCCCKDEQKLLKLDNDHKVSENNFQFVKLAPALILHNTAFTFKNHSSVSEEFPYAHAPPRTSNVPLFIRNCVYLI